MTAVRVVAIALVGLLAGCEPEPGDPTPEPFDYPLDDVLRVNHLQAVGTHNSYHVAPDPYLIDEWDFTMPSLTDQLQLHGVRQFELDVHLEGDGSNGFRVYHAPVVDDGTSCERLVDCCSQGG